MTTLPVGSQERKDIPLQRGCFDYFPAALAEVARLSLAANQKHNPGEDMHWARGKSMDHADCIARHQIERGTVDTDGFYHDVKVAWRALAQLQELMEKNGAPLARGAREDPTATSAPLILVTPRGIISEDQPAKIDDGPPRTRAKLIESALLDGHTHRTFLYKTSRDGKIAYYLNEAGERWRCDGCGTDSIFEYYNSLDRVKKYMHELPEQRGILCSQSGCNGLVVPPRG